jgi:hypothetical protein
MPWLSPVIEKTAPRPPVMLGEPSSLQLTGYVIQRVGRTIAKFIHQ